MELVDSTAVRWRLDRGVGCIVLASAATGNALGRAMLQRLDAALESLVGADTCRAIVIRADGDTFSCGFDLAEAAADGLEGMQDLSAAHAFASCLVRISQAPQAVIAAVHGRALGGAVGLLAACDIVIADEDAVVQLPEVIAGMIPAIVTPFLLMRVPRAKARYLALSSRGMRAREAYHCGLVDEIASDSLDAAVERQVKRLLRSSPAAIAEYKRGLSQRAGLGGEADAAVVWLKRWLADPATRGDIAEFAGGFAPSWFGVSGRSQE